MTPLWADSLERQLRKAYGGEWLITTARSAIDDRVVVTVRYRQPGYNKRLLGHHWEAAEYMRVPPTEAAWQAAWDVAEEMVPEATRLDVMQGAAMERHLLLWRDTDV